MTSNKASQEDQQTSRPKRNQVKGEKKNEDPEWAVTYTTKFLQDLAHGPFQQTGAQMDVWIDDAKGILNTFMDSELKKDKYKALGKRLGNDDDSWLRDLSRIVDEAMEFHGNDENFQRAKEAMSETSPGRSPDIFLTDLMRRICALPSMPAPAIGNGRSRASKDRARLRYRIAYGLILTALHDIQNNPGKHFSSLLRGVTAAKWTNDSAVGARPSTPTSNETTSSQKRSADASPTHKTKPKRRKNAEATPDESPTQLQLQQEPERAEPASSRRLSAADPGAVALDDDLDSAPGSFEKVEDLIEANLVNDLRARLDKEERSRKEAEAKLTAVREAIAGLETAVERVKAAVQVA